MKPLMITETLVPNVDLDGILLDDIKEYMYKMLDQKLLQSYPSITNIRFVSDYDPYDDGRTIIKIVGDRFETKEEHQKRSDLIKRFNKQKREKKKIAKLARIEELEKQLAKLKGNK